ncbi:MAG: hypothetical protein ABIC40_06115 [bacterium]
MTAFMLSLIRSVEENPAIAPPEQGLGVWAWILLIFGCVVLYGGLTRSLIIAYKHSKDKAPTADEEDSPDP